VNGLSSLLRLLLISGTMLCTTARAADISLDTAPPVEGAAKRIALIIGNAAYESAPLRNPVNDARAMSATLRELGFEVTALENVSQSAMKQAIDDYGDSLQKAGKSTVGLFYYSGHGVQAKGRNYLIPVGAKIRSERHIEYESVDVARVLTVMEDAGNVLNIVILDACRDDPFARASRNAGSGLAMLEAASGTLVAYATAPGRTADDGAGANGLYTERLVRHMRTPGLKVEEVFKRVRADVERLSGGAQVPWESSSLKGDFYFTGKPQELAAAAVGAGTASIEEQALWKAIEASTNIRDFQDYLQRYPQGRFVGAARTKMLQLGDIARPLIAPDRAILSLASTPPGALVYLDNGYTGKTPLDVPDLQPRKYLVEMRLPGYTTWKEEVVLRAGQQLNLTEVLHESKLAALDVRSVDSSFDVFMNGALRGRGGSIIDGIEPGAYEVEVRRPRSRTWKETMSLQAGETRDLYVPVMNAYRTAIFPGRLTGKYIDYVSRKHGTRTSGEWALLGVHEALQREPGFQLVYTHYDGFSIPKQTLSDIQKNTWKGLLAPEVDTAFLRKKGREMDLDAILMLVFVDPGDSGPILVYVYDPRNDQMFQASGSWRTGNTTSQVTKVTEATLDQFVQAREAR